LVLIVRNSSTVFIFLRVSENRVLKKVFGRKKDEVRGEQKRLHKAEICDL